MKSCVRLIAVSLAAIALAHAGGVTGARGDVTSLTIGSAVVPPGATVGVEIVAEATSPGIGALTLDVSYDASLLELQGCVPAPAEFSLCNPIYREDTVRIVGAAVPGLSGRTVLGGLVFTAGTGEGEAKLRIAVSQLADPDGVAIAVTPTDGTITIAASETPSIPASSTPGPTMFSVEAARAAALTPAGVGTQDAGTADTAAAQADSGGSSAGAWLLAGAGLVFVAGGVYAITRMRKKA